MKFKSVPGVNCQEASREELLGFPSTAPHSVRVHAFDTQHRRSAGSRGGEGFRSLRAS